MALDVRGCCLPLCMIVCEDVYLQQSVDVYDSVQNSVYLGMQGLDFGVEGAV